MYENRTILTRCYKGHSLLVEYDMVGMTMECPICGTEFLVGEAEPEESTPERSLMIKVFVSAVCIGLGFAIAVPAKHFGWGWLMYPAWVNAAIFAWRAIGLVTARFDIFTWLTPLKKWWLKKRLQRQIERNRRGGGSDPENRQ